MNTTDKGTIAEAGALASFVNSGFTVLQPFGPCRYDFAVDDGTRLWRVQVKTGRLCDDGAILKFSTESVSSGGRHRRDYSETDIDVFAVWTPNQEMLVIPVGACARGSQSLRLVPSGNGQAKGILWADDFKWSGAMPAPVLRSVSKRA